MDDAVQQRPSKRSRPISALIPKSENELNISKSKQEKNGLITPAKSITKEKLHEFHSYSERDDKQKNLKSRKINSISTSVKTPSKKLALSEIKSTTTPLAFKIKEDVPPTPTTPKIPISNLTPKQNLKPLEQPNDKIPLQILLDQAQEQPFKEIPMLKNDSSNFTSISLDHDTSSLLYQAQLPFVHMNSWYRVTQSQVLERNIDVEATHIIISCENFSDCLVSVICQKLSDDSLERVLLLNYRQHPYISLKIKKMESGSKISLIEGVKVLDSLKLYRNWKLIST